MASESARDVILQYLPDFCTWNWGKLYTDTTDFTRIGSGDVLHLDGLHYLVLRDEVERRFGSEDPKFWVKRCRVLETGEARILKLVFFEGFIMHLGPFSIPCYRCPGKETRILDLVRGDSRFAQGRTVYDDKGNAVRILELIRGRRMEDEIDAIRADHPTYVREYLPGLLEMLINACEAVRFLHLHGEQHGDIRRDHLWYDSERGIYRWLDFDHAFVCPESPFCLDLLGLGNILLFLAGKGVWSKLELMDHRIQGRDLLESLEPGDFHLLHKRRIVNLRKLFPYLPERLNNMLMRYAEGSNALYETVDEFLDDLRPCPDLLRKGP